MTDNFVDPIQLCDEIGCLKPALSPDYNICMDHYYKYNNHIKQGKEDSNKMASINDKTHNRVHKPMDQSTLDTLSKVSKDINDNNEKLLNPLNKISGKYTRISGPITGPINGTMSTHINATQWNVANINTGYNALQGGSFPPVVQPSWNPLDIDTIPTPVEPNPNIDMELDIYKNEFEEIGVVTIGGGRSAYGILEHGIYTPPSEQLVLIGLIDEVSQNEDDLYAKFPDGEIIPFKGHVEKFSIEMSTWNDLKRSDLTGNEIRKAAICKIYINQRLARIIEGIDIQDLLLKVNRAIEQLKVQPFTICRQGADLVNREIYYDNQPAIINYINELENVIYIIPDSKYIPFFTPPPHAVEDGETDEWLQKFGSGMLVHDYDEKIWWWRNNNGNVDPSTDPFYKQFPQPVQPPIVEPNDLGKKFDPNTYYPNDLGKKFDPNTYYPDDEGNYYIKGGSISGSIIDKSTVDAPSINRIDTSPKRAIDNNKIEVIEKNKIEAMENIEAIKNINKYYYGKRTGMLKSPKSTIPKKDIYDEIEKEVKN